MTSLFGEWVRAAFAPPRYLSPPLAGIDVSTSGVKAVRLSEGSHGLILAGYADERLISGAFADGEIVDRAVVAAAVAAAAKTAGIYAANVSLPESKSYLFETSVPGGDKAEWRTAPPT
jgi:Tfp pilus assembly PilM family ATPase